MKKLEFGSGVSLRLWDVAAKVTEEVFHDRAEFGGAGHRYQKVHLEQQIQVSLDVLVPEERSCCSGCNRKMPTLIGAGPEALSYVVRNAEDGRIVFPHTQGELIREERDSYPCPGWKRIEDALLCPDCFGDFKAWLKGKKV